MLIGYSQRLARQQNPSFAASNKKVRSRRDIMDPRENVLPTERPTGTVRIHRYVVDGKESRQGELASQPFIVAGADLPEAGTAYGFSREEAFLQWAAGTRHAPSFAQAIGTIKLGQQLEGTDIAARALKRIEATVERLQRELEELSRETGLAMGDPDFLIQAHISRSVLEPPVLGTALLFDKVQGSLLNPDFSGAFFPVSFVIPTFFGFNDKASGALVLGLCSLHDKTFYRGAAAFMIGGPGAVRFILSDLGFDNRAASGISI
jgi:hypothetical protein